MKVFKVAAATISSGLLIGLTSLPVWSMTGANEPQVLEEASAPPAQGLRSWLEPSPSNAGAKTHARCATARLYSEHDVVGDPESCIARGGGLNLEGPSQVWSFGLGF